MWANSHVLIRWVFTSTCSRWVWNPDCCPTCSVLDCMCCWCLRKKDFPWQCLKIRFRRLKDHLKICDMKNWNNRFKFTWQLDLLIWKHLLNICIPQSVNRSLIFKLTIQNWREIYDQWLIFCVSFHWITLKHQFQRQFAKFKNFSLQSSTLLIR